MFYSLINVLFTYCPSCCSIVKLCLTLCNPMNCNTPGFLVLHYLPEFAQTLVLQVGDATQPSHLLLPTSFPTLNLSQHQGLFQWILTGLQILQCSNDDTDEGLCFHKRVRWVSWVTKVHVFIVQLMTFRSFKSVLRYMHNRLDESRRLWRKEDNIKFKQSQENRIYFL